MRRISRIMPSDMSRSTSAIRNSALLQVEPNIVLPISTTILLVMVEVGAKSDEATIGVLPMSICTAMVSPTALAIARTTEVRIPGSAAGINKPLLKYRLSEGGKSRNKLKSASMTYRVYRYAGYDPVRSSLFFISYAVNGVWKYFH